MTNSVEHGMEMAGRLNDVVTATLGQPQVLQDSESSDPVKVVLATTKLALPSGIKLSVSSDKLAEFEKARANELKTKGSTTFALKNTKEPEDTTAVAFTMGFGPLSMVRLIDGPRALCFAVLSPLTSLEDQRLHFIRLRRKTTEGGIYIPDEFNPRRTDGGVNILDMVTLLGGSGSLVTAASHGPDNVRFGAYDDHLLTEMAKAKKASAMAERTAGIYHRLKGEGLSETAIKKTLAHQADELQEKQQVAQATSAQGPQDLMRPTDLFGAPIEVDERIHNLEPINAAITLTRDDVDVDALLMNRVVPNRADAPTLQKIMKTSSLPPVMELYKGLGFFSVMVTNEVDDLRMGLTEAREVA